MTDTEYKLVTVNTAPERAARLIGRMTTALSDRYCITHVANCESQLPVTYCIELTLKCKRNRRGRTDSTTASAGYPSK